MPTLLWKSLYMGWGCGRICALRGMGRFGPVSAGGSDCGLLSAKGTPPRAEMWLPSGETPVAG